MSVDLSQPVVWTSRGNVNESDVEKFSEWEFPNPQTVVHILGCKDKVTGEVLKRGVWVFTIGNDATAGSGQLNQGQG